MIQRWQKSHEIVSQALTILINLDHRGGCGAEPNTGDGAGILMQIPHEFMKAELAKQGVNLPPEGDYAVAMIFCSPNEKARMEGRARFEKVVAEEGQKVIAWRDVPTDNTGLGKSSLSCEPFVQQAFIAKSPLIEDSLAFERKLLVIRKRSHGAVKAAKIDTYWYISSLSSRTIVYKGMLRPEQVGKYYLDLDNPQLETALALVHSRFSTNTFPSWERAHPYRYITHNGEINTLRGNINWMHARQALFESDVFRDDLRKVQPIINIEGSDSLIFDNALEIMVLSGRSLSHAMMMMIPEPWSGHESMSPEKKSLLSISFLFNGTLGWTSFNRFY